MALCFLDLHSASRYVLERTASFTAGTLGLSVDRLIMAGTHTHTGPGQFYGNSLYDTFADGLPQGPALATHVGNQVGLTIVEATNAARHAATDFTVEVRYTESLTSDRRVDGRDNTELAKRWRFGAPVLGGGGG